MIGEIQSISLEHTLQIKEDNNIKGDFIVSGSYKMTEASTIAEEFSYKIPVDIYIDEEYNLDHATVDIDDFNYSIVNDDTLSVKIDVLLDKMELVKQNKEVSTEEELIQAQVDKEYLKLNQEIKTEDEDQRKETEAVIEEIDSSQKAEEIHRNLEEEEQSFLTTSEKDT